MTRHNTYHVPFPDCDDGDERTGRQCGASGNSSGGDSGTNTFVHSKFERTMNIFTEFEIP